MVVGNDCEFSEKRGRGGFGSSLIQQGRNTSKCLNHEQVRPELLTTAEST